MNTQLPLGRISSIDEKGRKISLFPAESPGKFKNLRSVVHGILILVFLGLPWLTINGKQALLLDIAKREFLLFGFHFRSHDAPILVFLFITFTFLIAFSTLLFGRIWCGWACPQTVFIESVFRKVEIWIEGSHRNRAALAKGPWTSDKTLRFISKHFFYLIISLIITHSFLAYFVGTDSLERMMTRAPTENWTSFLLIFFSTAVIYFNFGWFREQFCIVMCPYGRFQSVIVDSMSLIVGYDEKRGEPRGKIGTSGAGACVNCLRCVQVCPTGIDIRRGQQMECIGCAACIDACDTVMEKIGRPKGLIRYSTLKALDGKTGRILRPRVFLYSGFLILGVAGLILLLRQFSFLEVTILKVKEVPYQVMIVNQEEIVVNHFRLKISNQSDQVALYKLEFDEPSLKKHPLLALPTNPVKILPQETLTLDFFVKLPKKEFVMGQQSLNLVGSTDTLRQDHPIKVIGPF